MAASQLPASVGQLGIGEALLAVQERGAAAFVRLSELDMLRLPRLCVLDLRFGAWDVEGVIVAALLVRLEKRVEHTYRVWIDGATPSGVGIVQNLSRQRDFWVHLVGDFDRRVSRTRNSLCIRARRMLAELERRKPWPRERFDAVTAALDTLYPTFSQLWVAIRDARYPF